MFSFEYDEGDAVAVIKIGSHSILDRRDERMTLLHYLLTVQNKG